MEKRAVRASIEKYGDFLNIAQVAQMLGLDRDVVKRDFLQGLEYIPTGKSKLYFKEDILNVLMDKKRR